MGGVRVLGQKSLFETKERIKGKTMGAIYPPDGKAGEYSRWALNLYRGCTHGCFYCYGPGAAFRSQKDFFADPVEMKNVLSKLDRDRHVFKAEGHTGPVLLSFLSDPYQPVETETRLTRRAIELLKDAGISVNILSKAGLRATRDFDLLDPNDWVGTTLTFSNESQSLKEEPKAGTPMERVEYLRTAKERGLKTWVSIEPIVDPVQALQMIEMTMLYCDHFKIGKLNYNKIERGERREKTKKTHDAIDWNRFLRKTIDTLEGHGFVRTLEPATYKGRDYYIKQDTKLYIDSNGGR
jgi:DNA repair photolyase